MRDVYAGEAQFLAWGDGPSGPWVKILLPDSDDLAPFRGMTAAKKAMAGQLLAVKIVEVEPEPEKRPEGDHPHRTQGPLCTLACRWCRDPEFLAWAGFNWPHTDDGGSRPLTQEEARALILDVCKVGSRKDLDTVPTAGATFQREFRGPFMEYLGRAT